MKWVSLLLWAGADPYVGGQSDPEYSYVGDDDACAIEYAIIYKHLDILRMKKMPHDPKRPKAFMCLECACGSKSASYAECLLELGYPVNDRADGTSSLVASIYSRVPTYFTHIPPKDGHGWIINRHTDSAAVAEKTQILELILKHGGAVAACR